MKAIDRLLDEEDHGQALSRLRRLAVAYPTHGGVRMRLTEAIEAVQGTSAAAAAALDWCAVSPRSVAALETTLGYCAALGRVALADHLACRLAELGEQTPGFPLSDATRESICLQPDGSFAEGEQVLAFDRGLTYLEGGAYRQAVVELAGNPFMPARNNYALALFHSGEVQAALTQFQDNVAQSPENLLALSWVFHLQLFLGDEQGAARTHELLAPAVPPRSFDALAQVSALLLSGDDELASQAFERAESQDWFEQAVPGDQARLLHLGAVAAARAGNEELAEELWDEALSVSPDLAEARENRSELRRSPAERRGSWAYEFAQFLPLRWLEEIRSISSATAAHGDEKLLRLFSTVANPYLRALYLVSDETAQRLSRLLLLERAKRGDAEAADVLRQMLSLPRGLLRDRMDLMTDLREAGLIPRDEAVDMWCETGISSVTFVKQRIDREPKRTGLPAAWDAKFEESILAFRRGDKATAEGILWEIEARFPRHPTVLCNLGTSHLSRGESGQAEALLRRSVQADPDYLFGRCNLARLLSLRGDTEEAAALLKGLQLRETLHVDEAFALYGSEALLQKLNGEDEKAEQLLQSLEWVAEDMDEQHRYEETRDLIRSVSIPAGRVPRVLKALSRTPADSTA